MKYVVSNGGIMSVVEAVSASDAKAWFVANYLTLSVRPALDEDVGWYLGMSDTEKVPQTEAYWARKQAKA